MSEKHFKEQLMQLVFHEVRQAKEEGKDISSFLARFQLSEHVLVDQNCLREFSADELSSIYSQPQELPKVASYPYVEPESWDEIREACSGFSGWGSSLVETETLFEKIYGGLLGRCVGCSLGNPFPTGSVGPNGESGYDILKGYLEAAGAWPLTNYLPAKSPYPNLVLSSPDSCLENISFVEPDDDLRYTVLSLKALETYGFSLTTSDIARIWLENLPYNLVSTAERQAYANLVNVVRQSKTYVLSEEDIRFISSYLNPYREWIGAQIRADGWAYACPGDPAKAAHLAWTDARLSHQKNAVYGAMYMAALIAAAFVSTDAEEAVEVAVRFIPPKSRLYSAINQARLIAKQCLEQEELIREIHRHFGAYHPVHSINNAAAVTASLLYGGDDFTKCVSTAVLVGWDSDCNGASVGSVWGVLYGASAIPSYWTEPLNDTLFTGVAGFEPISIAKCAERFVKVAKGGGDNLK